MAPNKTMQMDIRGGEGKGNRGQHGEEQEILQNSMIMCKIMTILFDHILHTFQKKQVW